jgi:GspD-like, N0 domain
MLSKTVSWNCGWPGQSEEHLGRTRVVKIMETLWRIRAQPVRRGMRTLILGGALIATAALAAGHGSDEKITPNFRDADLAQIAETVSAVTGKTLVLDPHVHADCLGGQLGRSQDQRRELECRVDFRVLSGHHDQQTGRVDECPGRGRRNRSDAFKTRDYSRTKHNLVIFIRPKILRTPEQTAIVTDSKYNYIIEEQHKADKKGSAPLLPSETPPLLPPLNGGPP